MGFKRLARRRRATAEIVPDAFQAEPVASTGQKAEEVTAAMVAGEPRGEASPVAAAAESRVLREPIMMESEESEEEDPVETELVVDEASATDDEVPDEVENEDEDVDLKDEGDSSGSESDDAENDEMDPSLFTSHLASEEAKNKESQIFVGGLPKDCVEEDIRKVFSEFGKIESVKIVNNPLTNRIKGFAFVRYADARDAMKALANLNEGTKVKGKKAHVAASQHNNTLYLGNICKTWTKDQARHQRTFSLNFNVRRTIKGLGIEEFEMSLPDDPDSGGRNKGFAFVQFALHCDAMAAFHRLRKPDAIFGTNRSAKVSFAQTPLMPSEDLLMKVKTVYLEHIPLSWDEEKIEECCKEYGVIKKIALFHKLLRSKKKDISFVEFCLRDNALACVQGINEAKIGDGKVKVVASLARPVCKGRLAKQGTKGGYKVNTFTSITRTCPPDQMKAHENEVIAMEHEPCKLSNGNKRKHVSQGLTEIQKASQQYKGQRQPRGSKRTYLSERPAKKERKICAEDVLIKSSERGRVGDFGGPRGGHAGQLPIADMIHPTGSEHASPTALRAPYAGYASYTVFQRSERRPSL
ncbi:hypothetical protein EJB05_28064, partial [Eragrostis curvula]